VCVLRNALVLRDARSPERAFNALRTALVLALASRPVLRVSFGLALRVALRLVLSGVLLPTVFGALGVATVRLPRPVARLEARLTSLPALLRAVGRADEWDAVEREIAALFRGPAPLPVVRRLEVRVRWHGVLRPEVRVRWRGVPRHVVRARLDEARRLSSRPQRGPRPIARSREQSRQPSYQY
jgi:hypothetical protein